MSELKKIPPKETNKHFSKEPDTHIMAGNNQFPEQFFFDLNNIDTYIPVTLSNLNSDDIPDSTEISRHVYLCKSNENSDSGKSRNAHLLEVLLKIPVANKQATDTVLNFNVDYIKHLT